MIGLSEPHKKHSHILHLRLRLPNLSTQQTHARARQARPRPRARAAAAGALRRGLHVRAAGALRAARPQGPLQARARRAAQGLHGCALRGVGGGLCGWLLEEGARRGALSQSPVPRLPAALPDCRAGGRRASELRSGTHACTQHTTHTTHTTQQNPHLNAPKNQASTTPTRSRSRPR